MFTGTRVRLRPHRDPQEERKREFRAAASSCSEVAREPSFGPNAANHGRDWTSGGTLGNPSVSKRRGSKVGVGPCLAQADPCEASVGHSSTDIDQDVAWTWPASTNIGRSRADAGQTRPTSDQHWSEFVKPKPTLANILGQNCPHNSGQTLASLDQSWPVVCAMLASCLCNVGQCCASWPELTNVGRKLADFGQAWPQRG